MFLPSYFEEVFSSTQVIAGLLSVARAQLVGAEGSLVSCSWQEEPQFPLCGRGHWTAKSWPICPEEAPYPKLPRILVARGTPSPAGVPFSLWSDPHRGDVDRGQYSIASGVFAWITSKHFYDVSGRQDLRQPMPAPPTVLHSNSHDQD